MSSVVLLDSVIVIGAAIESDEHHDRAYPIFEGIDNGELPPAVLHDYVYCEIVNFLTKSSGISTSDVIDFLRRLDTAEYFRIHRVSNEHFLTGKNDVYFQYDELSLTDAISVSFMEDIGIDYMYSLDGGFDEVGSITRINTAVSPY